MEVADILYRFGMDIIIAEEFKRYADAGYENFGGKYIIDNVEISNIFEHTFFKDICTCVYLNYFLDKSISSFYDRIITANNIENDDKISYYIDNGNYLSKNLSFNIEHNTFYSIECRVDDEDHGFIIATDDVYAIVCNTYANTGAMFKRTHTIHNLRYLWQMFFDTQNFERGDDNVDHFTSFLFTTITGIPKLSGNKKYYNNILKISIIYNIAEKEQQVINTIINYIKNNLYDLLYDPQVRDHLKFIINKLKK